MVPSIFLSHTWKDKGFARTLASDLAAQNVYVWIDEAEIQVGDSLIEKIRSAIDNVDYVGVILSPNSINSEWVKKEVDIAMNQEIENKLVKVLPILYKNCELPGFLKGKLYADFTNPREYQLALDKLLIKLGISKHIYPTSFIQSLYPKLIPFMQETDNIIRKLPEKGYPDYSSGIPFDSKTFEIHASLSKSFFPIKNQVLNEIELPRELLDNFIHLNHLYESLLELRKNKQYCQEFLQTEASPKYRIRTADRLNESDTSINGIHKKYQDLISDIRKHTPKSKLGLLEAIFHIDRNLDICYLATHHMTHLDKPIPT